MKINLPGAWRAATFAAAMAAAMSAAHAAEIKVIAANAVKEPFLELVAVFEKTSGHKVTAVWSGTAGIVKRIVEGEVADLVIVGSDTVDRLALEGKLLAESKAVFVKTGVGVAVRSGAPKPDISSEEAVKSAVLAARSVAYSSGASGAYVAELFKRLGVAEQVKGKLVLPPSNVAVGELLARGEVDLGFQQISELAHFAGITYVGPLPAAIQNITVYAAAVHSAAPAADAARALAMFITGPQARPAILKAGMEPG